MHPLNKNDLVADTLLIRAVTPGNFADNELLFELFNPDNKRDKLKLSVWNNSIVTKKMCMLKHKKINKNTIGIVAISFKECLDLGLHLERDEPDIKHLGHIIIDFNQLLSRDKRRIIARKLTRHASVRNWVYPKALMTRKLYIPDY